MKQTMSCHLARARPSQRVVIDAAECGEGTWVMPLLAAPSLFQGVSQTSINNFPRATPPGPGRTTWTAAMATKSFNRSLGDQAVLLREIAVDSEALRLLEFSTTSEVQEAFETKLLFYIPARFHPDIDRANLCRHFLSWCANPKLTCPPALSQAVSRRKAHKEARRTLKRDFVTITGLNWSDARRDQYLSTIPTIIVDELPEAYPPIGRWMFESESIARKWRHHITKGRQPDARYPRLPMLKLDAQRLAHDVDASESRIFITKAGNLVAAVLRDICPDDEVLTWVDAVIVDTVRLRKSIRVSRSHFFVSYPA